VVGGRNPDDPITADDEDVVIFNEFFKEETQFILLTADVVYSEAMTDDEEFLAEKLFCELYASLLTIKPTALRCEFTFLPAEPVRRLLTTEGAAYSIAVIASQGEVRGVRAITACTSRGDCNTDQYCSPNYARCLSSKPDTETCHAVLSCDDGHYCAEGRVCAVLPFCTYGEEDSCVYGSHCSPNYGVCLVDSTAQCNAVTACNTFLAGDGFGVNDIAATTCVGRSCVADSTSMPTSMPSSMPSSI